MKAGILYYKKDKTKEKMQKEYGFKVHENNNTFKFSLSEIEE